MDKAMNKKAVLETLNLIMEMELAGVVRYTHYALMIFGYNRIPIVKWLNDQADEGLIHQRRGLHHVPFALPRHAHPREPVQLAVDNRSQAFERLRVAAAPCLQYSGQSDRRALVHRRIVAQAGSERVLRVAGGSQRG